MGTDITLTVETRNIHNGEWYNATLLMDSPNDAKYADARPSEREKLYSFYPQARNYDLFALLDGCRGGRHGLEPLFPARGLPIDIDRDNFHAVRGQEFTWASYLELDGIKWPTYSYGGVEFDLSKCGFALWVKGDLTVLAEEYGPENVRVLMEFDS